MEMPCKCGCGTIINISRSTYYRMKNGQPGGYVLGHHQKGNKNNQWTGGKTSDRRGYVFIRRPDHPNAWPNGMIAEHRFIMSEHLKRPLLKNEVIHHLNENRSDNRIENLILMHRGIHARHHIGGEKHYKWKGELNPKQCPTCKKYFLKPRALHMRTTYCSPACIKHG